MNVQKKNDNGDCRHASNRNLRHVDFGIRRRTNRKIHRVVAVDEKLGIVAARMNFGPGSTFQGGGELDVWHSFKIYGDQIHAAEAYCEIVPAGTSSGW